MLKKLFQNLFPAFPTIFIGWLFIFSYPSLTVAVENKATNTSEMQNLLRARIEASGTGSIQIENEQIYAHQALPIFYEKRGFLPAWVDDSGQLFFVTQAIAAIDNLSSDGLRPKDYHLDRIKIIFSDIFSHRQEKTGMNPEKLLDLELLLTDAYMICGAHMVKGRINPESIDPEWFANLREIDMPQVLEKAIESQRISESLLALRPDQKGYLFLINALKNYRNMSQDGGWTPVPEGPSLKPGDSNSKIPIIRNRLSMTGDLEPEQPESDDYFDDALKNAVIHFQKRHGIDPDGVIGPETISTMNVSVENRIDQILLNLERWRWLPQNLGEQHILVNIADFTLAVREHDVTIIEMRAVVGRSYRRTPVFSDKMTYLVINPSWNIPQELAVADILPTVQKNPDYLAEMRIIVFRGWGTDSQLIDPKTVDWASVSPQHFPYYYRQQPGPKNALGNFKFMFPNKFNVYIHDTPSRDLFQKTSRSFSSGCIRIEKPMALAQYLLSGDPAWPSDKIVSAVSTGIEQTVSLSRAVPVHILYWTAWAAPDGVVYFRKDIYGRDERLLKALVLPAPENNT